MGAVWIDGKRCYRPEVDKDNDIICRVLADLEKGGSCDLYGLWHALCKEGWCQLHECSPEEFGKKLASFGFEIVRSHGADGRELRMQVTLTVSETPIG